VLAKWIGWSLVDVQSLDPHEYEVLIDLVKTSTTVDE
jgi:hypothetical protein